MSDDAAPVTYRAREPSPWRRRDRPWQYSVLAYGAIAFGYVGFIWKGTTLVPYFSDMKWLNPDYVRPVLTTDEFVVAVVRTLLGMLASLLSLAGGIGLLRMRRWGAALLKIYAVTAIVLTLAVGAYNLWRLDADVQRMHTSTTQPVTDDDGTPIDPRQTRNERALVATLAPVLMLVWPVAMLSMLTSRRLSASLAGRLNHP